MLSDTGSEVLQDENVEMKVSQIDQTEQLLRNIDEAKLELLQNEVNQLKTLLQEIQ